MVVGTKPLDDIIACGAAQVCESFAVMSCMLQYVWPITLAPPPNFFVIFPEKQGSLK